MSLSGVDEIDKALTLLSKQNARLFTKIWQGAPRTTKKELLDYMFPLVVDLIYQGQDDAAALALQQLNMQRAGLDLPVEIADHSSPEAVRESLRFLITVNGGEDIRKAVWGMVDRHILNGHRETMWLSAMAAGNGYARKPEPGACSFCLMLASRGAVYRSKEHAARVGAPGVVLRGNASAGDRFHDNCRCQAVEVRLGDGLPKEALEYRKLWVKTFYEGGQSKLETVDFQSTKSGWKEAVKKYQQG